MSTANAFMAQDPDFVLRGPGLNAANMRSVGWLDTLRVWRGCNGVIQLRPLHRHDLPGFLAAEFPPFGKGFVVEFRVRDRWDAQIPRSAVLVHRFYGGHSYLMPGLSAALDLVEGDIFDSGGGPFVAKDRVEVLSIDDGNQTATVRFSCEAAKQFPVDWHGVFGHVIGQVRADGSGAVFLGGRFIGVPPWNPMAEILVQVAEWTLAEDVSDPSLRDAVRRNALRGIAGLVQSAMEDLDPIRVPAPAPIEPLVDPCQQKQVP